MKRMLSLFTILAVLVAATPLFANPSLDKAKDGLMTVVKSPLHVSDDIKAETAGRHDLSLPFALVGGMFKGVFYMAKDVVTGTLDVATAPLEMVKK